LGLSKGSRPPIARSAQFRVGENAAMPLPGRGLRRKYGRHWSVERPSRWSSMTGCTPCQIGPDMRREEVVLADDRGGKPLRDKVCRGSCRCPENRA
jgi:hypothetical protein